MQPHTIAAAANRFISDESGQTSVEYAIMVGFIILVCFAGIVSLADITRDSFDSTAAAFQNSSN